MANATDKTEQADAGPRALSHPCGFCRNDLHELCPRFVHASNRADAGLLACPCPDHDNGDAATGQPAEAA